MQTNQLPTMNTDTSETNCCPRFEPAGWNEQEIVFENKPFVKVHTRSFFYVPLNMGSVMKNVMQAIEDAGAKSEDEYFMLSHDLSMWKAEHLIAVSKEVPGVEMERLSGTFLTKVFEGPYKNMRQWCKEMEEYVQSKGKETKRQYYFYTTCPKCAKHYGKNYVVGFAQIA